MTQLSPNWFDYAILIVYFGLVITIGVLARRAIANSEDFLLSGRSLPAVERDRRLRHPGR